MNTYMKLGLCALVLLVSFSFAKSSQAAEAFRFQYDMRAGSESSDVAVLQNWLMSQGYDIPALRSSSVAKGYFGSQTKAAVVRFQSAFGIPATGIVGPITRGRINAFLQAYTGDVTLKVVSPNGGEVLESGNAHRIQWNFISTTGPVVGGPTDNPYEARIDLYLERKVDDSVNIPHTNSVSGGISCGPDLCPPTPAIVLDKNIRISTTYNWVVGTDEKDNPVAPGQYKVLACVAGSTLICDRSDAFFTITPSTKIQNQASITTVSPNGGETWAPDSVQTIQWDFSKGLNNYQTYAVDIKISSYNPPVQCPAGYSCMMPAQQLNAVIAKNIPAQQEKYVWTVGTIISGDALPSHHYLMKICFAGTDKCAVSDAPFTIWKNLMPIALPN